MPPVDWDKAFWHLPVNDILRSVGAPTGIAANAMPITERRQHDRAHAE